MKQKDKKNILIVDDDKINLFMAVALLQDYYNVHGVVSGQHALKALEEKDYDVILMDINLGDYRMDGIKTMHMIRENRKHRCIKIFAVTAYSNNRESYIKQGFDEFLLKPVNESLIGLLNGSLAGEKGRGPLAA